MIRTQIQLTPEQIAGLKKIAAQSRRSMADLIREAVDRLLDNAGPRSEEDQFRRALNAAGRFRSGSRDISSRHDRYLEEAYRE
ncbi:MAG: ribbon-helix-helix protein, CopG family [Bryobacterales bacterium]